jgi:hypothetical protein
MASTSGEKELYRKWPHEQGDTAGTTTQEGRVMNLIPQKSKVPERLRKGLD